MRLWMNQYQHCVAGGEDLVDRETIRWQNCKVFPDFWLSRSKTKNKVIAWLFFDTQFKTTLYELLITFTFITTVKTCKGLTKPQNGRVTPEICTTAPKHLQKCTFSCNVGYTGSKRTPFSITCYDGRWSSSTGFYCSGKRKKKLCMTLDRAISFCKYTYVGACWAADSSLVAWKTTGLLLIPTNIVAESRTSRTKYKKRKKFLSVLSVL